MKKRIILHIAEAFGGGVVTFLANLANEQCKDNNSKVFIIHGIRPETHTNYKDFFDSRVTLIKATYFRQKIKLKDEWKAIKEIRKLIKTIKPDVIHMHSSQSGVLGKLASIGYHASKIYSPHGFSFLKQDVPKWKCFIFKAIEKIFSYFDCILVASSQTEYDVAKSITSKAVLITNGINTSSLEPYLFTHCQNKTPIVGMVGRAVPQKNPALFNNIAEVMPNIHFEWIGDGELRNELKAKNIHIVGWGPREEALEYVSKCDIYIMTSLWEGMPIALLEAMFLKKPCIVTDVVGNRDVIINNVNGFVCNTIDDFSEKIDFLINNKDRCRQMGEQAHYDIITKYNSKIMADKFSTIYNKNLDKQLVS